MADMAPGVRKLQFGIRDLILATMFVALGISLLLHAEGTFWQFARGGTLAHASFGAAIGCLAKSTCRFAAYGFGVGLLFVAYALIARNL